MSPVGGRTNQMIKNITMPLQQLKPEYCGKKAMV